MCASHRCLRWRAASRRSYDGSVVSSRYSLPVILWSWRELKPFKAFIVFGDSDHASLPRVMPGSHYAIFVVKTSVVRLNDERRKSRTGEVLACGEPDVAQSARAPPPPRDDHAMAHVGAASSPSLEKRLPW